MLFSTDPLKFLLEPKNRTAFVGESVWFHCAATGSPKPRITWLKHDQGGRPLNEEKYKAHANGSLNIRNAQLSDTGRYFCIAATHVDLRQKTVHLVVKGKLTLILSSLLDQFAWVGGGEATRHLGNPANRPLFSRLLYTSRPPARPPPPLHSLLQLITVTTGYNATNFKLCCKHVCDFSRRAPDSTFTRQRIRNVKA